MDISFLEGHGNSRTGHTSLRPDTSPLSGLRMVQVIIMIVISLVRFAGLAKVHGHVLGVELRYLLFQLSRAPNKLLMGIPQRSFCFLPSFAHYFYSQSIHYILEVLSMMYVGCACDLTRLSPPLIFPSHSTVALEGGANCQVAIGAVRLGR
jgi:hypothetical protein